MKEKKTVVDACSLEVEKSFSMKRKVFRCINCNLIPFLSLSKNNTNVIINCLNNHHTEITLNDFMEKGFDNSLDRVKCSECGIIHEPKKIFKFCKECNLIFCKQCSNKHLNNKNNHHIISIKKMDVICCFHKLKFNYFCKKCNENICENCLNSEHKDHEIIKFENFELKNENIEKIKNNIKIERNNINEVIKIFNKKIEALKVKFFELIQNKKNINKFKNNIIETLEIKGLNYQILNNIKELKFNSKALDINPMLNELDYIKELFNYLNNNITKNEKINNIDIEQIKHNEKNIILKISETNNIENVTKTILEEDNNLKNKDNGNNNKNNFINEKDINNEKIENNNNNSTILNDIPKNKDIDFNEIKDSKEKIASIEEKNKIKEGTKKDNSITPNEKDNNINENNQQNIEENKNIDNNINLDNIVNKDNNKETNIEKKDTKNSEEINLIIKDVLIPKNFLDCVPEDYLDNNENVIQSYEAIPNYNTIYKSLRSSSYTRKKIGLSQGKISEEEKYSNNNLDEETLKLKEMLKPKNNDNENDKNINIIDIDNENILKELYNLNDKDKTDKDEMPNLISCSNSIVVEENNTSSKKNEYEENKNNNSEIEEENNILEPIYSVINENEYDEMSNLENTNIIEDKNIDNANIYQNNDSNYNNSQTEKGEMIITKKDNDIDTENNNEITKNNNNFNKKESQTEKTVNDKNDIIDNNKEILNKENNEENNTNNNKEENKNKKINKDEKKDETNQEIENKENSKINNNKDIKELDKKENLENQNQNQNQKVIVKKEKKKENINSNDVNGGKNKLKDMDKEELELKYQNNKINENENKEKNKHEKKLKNENFIFPYINNNDMKRTINRNSSYDRNLKNGLKNFNKKLKKDNNKELEGKINEDENDIKNIILLNGNLNKSMNIESGIIKHKPFKNEKIYKNQPIHENNSNTNRIINKKVKLNVIVDDEHIKPIKKMKKRINIFFENDNKKYFDRESKSFNSNIIEDKNDNSLNLISSKINKYNPVKRRKLTNPEREKLKENKNSDSRLINNKKKKKINIIAVPLDESKIERNESIIIKKGGKRENTKEKIDPNKIRSITPIENLENKKLKNNISLNIKQKNNKKRKITPDNIIKYRKKNKKRISAPNSESIGKNKIINLSDIPSSEENKNLNKSFSIRKKRNYSIISINPNIILSSKDINYSFASKTKITSFTLEYKINCLLEINPIILCSGNYAGNIQLFNLQLNLEIQNIKEHDGKINSLFLLKDNCILSTSTDSQMKKIKLINNFNSYIVDFVFSGYNSSILKGIELTFNQKIICISWKEKLSVWSKSLKPKEKYINSLNIFEGETILDIIEISRSELLIAFENILGFFNYNTFNCNNSIRNIKISTQNNSICRINNNILGIIYDNKIQLVNLNNYSFGGLISMEQENINSMIKLKNGALLLVDENEKDGFCIINVKQYIFENSEFTFVSSKKDQYYNFERKLKKKISHLIEFSNGIVAESICGEYEGKDFGEIIVYE